MRDDYKSLDSISNYSKIYFYNYKEFFRTKYYRLKLIKKSTQIRLNLKIITIEF